MPNSLIATIVRETGQSEKESAQRLDAFCSHILAMLELEGRCQVDGLGEFEQTPERIRFRPAEELINVLKTVSPVLPDYAVPAPPGMTAPTPTSVGSAPAPDREASRPIERSKTESEKDVPEDPEETPQGQDWTIDRDPIVTRRVSSSLDPEADKPSSGPGDKPSTSGKSTTGKPPSESRSSSPDESASLPVVAPGSDSGSRNPAGSTPKKSGKVPASKLPARPAVTLSRDRTSRRSPSRHDGTGSGRTSLIVLGGAVVLILAVVAITQFGLWPDLSGDDPDITQNDPLADNSGDIQPGDLANGTAESLAADSTAALDTPPEAESSLPATGQAARQEPVRDPAETAEPETLAPAPVSYSLDTSMTGYTVVVGSSVSRSDADATMSQYSDLGMPYGVLEYEEDGLTRYRLGVGLFPTSQAADSVRQAMPEQLPEGAWVFRIR